MDEECAFIATEPHDPDGIGAKCVACGAAIPKGVVGPVILSASTQTATTENC